MSTGDLQAFLRKRFAATQDYFGFADRMIEVLGQEPVTVLVGPSKHSTPEPLSHLLSLMADWIGEFSAGKHDWLYRGVGLDRLPWILETGCDVCPPDAILFATDSPQKAMEYGRTGKVMQVFRRDRMDRSYRVFEPGAASSVVDEVRTRFPTEIKSEDGRIHLSRMPLGKFPGAGTRYELEYGWFIPGDPLEALQMVFLVDESPDVLRGAYRAANANGAGPRTGARTFRTAGIKTYPDTAPHASSSKPGTG